MRVFQHKTMIGVLLFYALYPLVCFLFRRRSEASVKSDPQSVAVDGTAVWDGGTVPVRSNQPETTMQDQSGEMEERLRAIPEENLSAVLQEDSRNDGAAKFTEMHVAVDKEAARPTVDDQAKVDLQDIMHFMKCLTVEGTVEDTSCPETNQSQTEDAKEMLQASNTVKSNSPDKYLSVVTEHWDEFINSGERSVGNPESTLNPLQTSSQTSLQVDKQGDAQTSWHFPVGPGLSQEVSCPQWTFPSASYYDTGEPTVPFEVMWRVWEELEAASETLPTQFTTDKPSVHFTVMSYNILAQDLLELNLHLYAHCPLEVLQWSYRCTLLLNEIQQWAPDILCLQEVQENHYHEHLYPVLSRMGYTCVYQRRTGTKTDGCAVCYQSSSFKEVAISKVEFFKPETGLLDRHNVGIVLLLRRLVTVGAEVKEAGPPLCVASTHLLFNPRRGDVKLAQLAIMLAEISSMVKSCNSRGEHCNVVFCGDFNSVPQMPLYQLITTGELSYQGIPTWMISGQEDLSYKPSYHRLFAPLWPSCLGISDTCQYTPEINMPKLDHTPGSRQYTHDFMLQLRFCPAACVRPQSLILIPGVTDVRPDTTGDVENYEKRFRERLRHRLDLESVYKHFLPGSGSPEVTTLHSQGGATVDYIFYSPKRNSTKDQRGYEKSAVKGLKLIGSLSLLSEDLLWSMNGLPNHIFPSDHLSLVAQFQLEIDDA